MSSPLLSSPSNLKQRHNRNKQCVNMTLGHAQWALPLVMTFNSTNQTHPLVTLWESNNWPFSPSESVRWRTNLHQQEHQCHHLTTTIFHTHTKPKLQAFLPLLQGTASEIRLPRILVGLMRFSTVLGAHWIPHHPDQTSLCSNLFSVGETGLVSAALHGCMRSTCVANTSSSHGSLKAVGSEPLRNSYIRTKVQTRQ